MERSGGSGGFRCFGSICAGESGENFAEHCWVLGFGIGAPPGPRGGWFRRVGGDGGGRWRELQNFSVAQSKSMSACDDGVSAECARAFGDAQKGQATEMCRAGVLLPQ